jgi:hypothetical protein
MGLRLRVCGNGSCTVLLFKTSDGLCPRCGTPGALVVFEAKDETGQE